LSEKQKNVYFVFCVTFYFTKEPCLKNLDLIFALKLQISLPEYSLPGQKFSRILSRIMKKRACKNARLSGQHGSAAGGRGCPIDRRSARIPALISALPSRRSWFFTDLVELEEYLLLRKL